MGDTPAGRVPALQSTDLVKLTDAAQALFGTLYDLERAHKAAAKARLVHELSKLDLLGPRSHYASVEDYTPTGDRA